MKLLTIMGTVFNAGNICSIRKTFVNTEKYDAETEEYETVPAIEVATNAGVINFLMTIETIDKTFGDIIMNLGQL